MCLLGCQGAAVALLVSFDCWLRISEVSGLKARDVVDNRGQGDPAGRGVAVYLETTKTGRRQAVIVESSEVAAILVAWRDAHRAQGLSEEALLFLPKKRLVFSVWKKSKTKLRTSFGKPPERIQ